MNRRQFGQLLATAAMGASILPRQVCEAVRSKVVMIGKSVVVDETDSTVFWETIYFRSSSGITEAMIKPRIVKSMDRV